MRLLVLMCLVGEAWAAPPVVLKFATIIPDGSAYAREAKAFGRNVEADTQGRVRIRWIFGAVAGDEAQMIERIKRGQLDGAATALGCGWLAPSLRVFRIPGQFQGRQESRQVMARLRQGALEEMRKSGFELIGIEPFGADIVFSNEPIRSLADLKRQRIWVWDQDEVWGAVAPILGVRGVKSPVDGVQKLIDDRAIDILLSLPTAALAYQWSSRFRYYTPLQGSYLQACLIVSNRSFDALSIEDQRSMRAAGAQAAAHFDKVCEAQDEQLLGGLLEKQGVKKVPLSPGFAAEYVRATGAAAERIDEKLVPRALREKVAGWIVELRGTKLRN